MKKAGIKTTGVECDSDGAIDVEKFFDDRRNQVVNWHDRLMDYSFGILDVKHESDSSEASAYRNDAATQIIKFLCDDTNNSRNFVDGWIGYCVRNGHPMTIESLFEKLSRTLSLSKT